MSRTTNKQLAAMSQEERSAWIASLSADETMVLHVPVGHRVSLLLIAHTKRVLVRDRHATTEDQLRALELLNSLTDSFLTPAAMVAVQPACATAAEMIKHALSLDGENERLTKSCDVLSSWE